MRLTPDNIHIPLVEAFGPDWREEAGEDFAAQLQAVDAVRCPGCDCWWEDGDLVTTYAHADAWCGPCWEAEAQEADLYSAYYDHCWDGADKANRIQSKQQHDRKEAAR